MTSPIDNPKETWIFGPYEIHIAGVPLRIPGTGKRPAVIDIITGATYAWNAGAKKIDVTIDPGMGFVSDTRKIKTPTISALTANGGVETDLSDDVTLQIIVDSLSMKIEGGQVATLYPLDVLADPETIAVRSFTGDAGAAVLHGQGALLATRFVAGSIDDEPAQIGALGVTAETTGVAFRGLGGSDLDALAHEDGGDEGDLIVVGRAVNVMSGPQASELDLRAKNRIRRSISADGALVQHSDLVAEYSGLPVGPAVLYSGDSGAAITHRVPSGGSFRIWEADSPDFELFSVTSEGASVTGNLGAAGQEQISVEAIDGGMGMQAFTDGMGADVLWNQESAALPKTGMTHSTSSDPEKITFVTAGRYIVSVAVTMDPQALLSYIAIAINVNGSTVISTNARAIPSAQTTVMATMPILVAASDYITVTAIVTGANTTLTEDVTTNWLRIARIP